MNHSLQESKRVHARTHTHAVAHNYLGNQKPFEPSRQTSRSSEHKEGGIGGWRACVCVCGCSVCEPRERVNYTWMKTTGCIPIQGQETGSEEVSGGGGEQ